MGNQTTTENPYVITLGNEKGGTGKSTTAVHLAVALLKLGYSVGTVDLDGRQGSLSRYLENRHSFAASNGLTIESPRHYRIMDSEAEYREDSQREERRRLLDVLASLSDRNFIVIDTPGDDSHLSRLGHEIADTLITPLNDSFVDIDVLAKVDREKREVVSPSRYCKTVWQLSNQRIVSGRPALDWIVMRNRLAHLEARNRREISMLLHQLARRIGFRLAPGFSERVVFRELFLKGLTLLDSAETSKTGSSRSHGNARQEIYGLLDAIGIRQPEALLDEAMG